MQSGMPDYLSERLSQMAASQSIPADVIEEMQRMEASGKSRGEICDWLRANHGIDKNPSNLYRILGSKVFSKDDRPRNSAWLKVDPASLQRVREMAASLGYRSQSGPKAGSSEGSLARLLEAIADGDISLVDCRSASAENGQ